MKYCKDESPGNELPPDFILNLDESSMAVDEKGQKIFARYGQRAIHSLDKNRMINTRMTSVNVISAGTATFHPFYIMEGKSRKHWINPHGAKAFPGDESLTCFGPHNKWALTLKGYMTDDVWENQFVPDLMIQISNLRREKNLPNQWVLLILDGFGSHSYCTKALIRLLQHKVKVLRLPSHTSSALQPLDTSVFRTVKAHFRSLMSGITANSHFRKITKFTIAQAFHKAFRRSIEDNKLAVAGFRSTGIWPRNHNWVIENQSKFSLSLAFSNSSTNRELAKISIASNCDLMAAQSIQAAKKALALFEMDPTLLQNFSLEIGVAAQHLQSLFARVACSEYSNMFQDNVLRMPFWIKILEQYEAYDERNPKPPPKRNTVTKWGELKSAPLDLTDTERLAKMSGIVFPPPLVDTPDGVNDENSDGEDVDGVADDENVHEIGDGEAGMVEIADNENMDDFDVPMEALDLEEEDDDERDDDNRKRAALDYVSGNLKRLRK